MFGILRGRSGERKLSEGIEALDQIVDTTLQTVSELGDDVRSHRPVLCAAQVVICEMFVLENPQLRDAQKQVLLTLSEKLRAKDPARLSLLIDSLYDCSEQQRCSIDDYLATSFAQQVLKQGGNTSPPPGLPEVMGQAMAGNWSMRYFAMGTRLVLAVLVDETALVQRIEISLSRLRSKTGGL
jgi:hypothetical protein